MPGGCVRKQSISDTSASPRASRRNSELLEMQNTTSASTPETSQRCVRKPCLRSRGWLTPRYSTPPQLWSVLLWRWGHPSKVLASWSKTATHCNNINVVWWHHFKVCGRALIYHSPAVFLFLKISWDMFKCIKTEDRQSWQLKLICLITQTGEKLIQLSTFKICPFVMKHSQVWRGEKQLGKTATL